MKIRAYLLGLVLLADASSAYAASVPLLQGPQDPSQMQAVINQTIQSMNAGVPGFASLPSTSRNYLDNGAMAVSQRGTGAVTGASTAGCAVLSYVADRWCVDTNVTSGVGKGQVITASPAPPANFQQSVKVWRDSGALTQPVEFMQEIETTRATQLAGKPVIASCFVQPLATFSGTTLTMNLITGTGTDEGLGALRSAVGMTASPAISPAFTGVAVTAFSAGAGSPSWAIGTAANWSRIYSAPLIVPTGTTEAAFAIGFAPVGSGSGATDGFAVTGCQLEIADPSQVVPTAFSFESPALDLARAQRFYWQVADPAATVEIPSACFVTAANTTVKCGVWLPQQMQAVPVTAIPVSASFGIVVTAGTAGTCTALAATASSNTVRSIGVTCTTGGTIALGSATPLIGAAAASANLNASADF